MPVLVNRARMTTATTGTGTITLGSAVTGYQSFADAGVTDGQTVRYVVEDGNNWEIGSGLYTAVGTTLARTVDESSNSGSAINLSGSASVFITAVSGDIVPAVAALSGTTPSVDVDAVDTVTLTTSGNTTFTFTNVPPSGTVGSFNLILTSGGSHTLTWPAAVVWEGGTQPAAPASGETDVYTFLTTDGGTTWYGFLAGDAMA